MDSNSVEKYRKCILLIAAGRTVDATTVENMMMAGGKSGTGADAKDDQEDDPMNIKDCTIDNEVSLCNTEMGDQHKLQSSWNTQFPLFIVCAWNAGRNRE